MGPRVDIGSCPARDSRVLMARSTPKQKPAVSASVIFIHIHCSFIICNPANPASLFSESTDIFIYIAGYAFKVFLSGFTLKIAISARLANIESYF